MMTACCKPFGLDFLLADRFQQGRSEEEVSFYLPHRHLWVYGKWLAAGVLVLYDEMSLPFPQMFAVEHSECI